MWKMKNHPVMLFDSLNEALWYNGYKKKNSFPWTIFWGEKTALPPNGPFSLFSQILSNMEHQPGPVFFVVIYHMIITIKVKKLKWSNFFEPLIWSSLVFLPKWSIEMSFGCFCVVIIVSIRFIWAIKQHFPMIFHFSLRKGPYGFGGVKELRKGEESFFLELRVFQMNINVRLQKIPNLVLYAQP